MVLAYDDMDMNPVPTDDDQMTEEILEENLLRQLTTVVVRIVIVVLVNARPIQTVLKAG